MSYRNQETQSSIWSHPFVPIMLIILLVQSAAAKGADPLDEWPTVDSSEANNFTSIDFLNGQFLALGATDTIPTSPEGGKWILRWSGTTARLTKAAYDNGLYVVLGNKEEYLATMGNNPSAGIGDLKRPVDQVSWENATIFYAKLTARERATGRLPVAYSYQLPTEAEWEYACRAGSTTAYAFGDNPNLNEFTWYFDKSYSGTRPVGFKKPNAWGLYDMHGNVFEWCADSLNPYPGGRIIDPLFVSEKGHVIRGGCYFTFDCRSAYRYGNWGGPGGFLGFRVILTRAR